MQKNYINNTGVMRNNFVDPVELRSKIEDPDQLSLGSVEHKHLGVVREGFKKASFSNIGTVKDQPLPTQSQPIAANARNQKSEGQTKFYPHQE